MQKGFYNLILIIVVAVLAVGGYAVYRFVVPAEEDETITDQEMDSGDNMVGESPVIKEDSMMGEGDVMIDSEGDMMEDENMMEGGSMIEYSGEVLAGDSAKFINFNKTDYEAALKTDKLIVLYFYANWCPICKAEIPKLYDAFNSLNTDEVVGFRVNYNDNETDGDEVALAREFGVAYQHTKVFVRNSERIGKWPDSWDKARYVSEIERRL